MLIVILRINHFEIITLKCCYSLYHLPSRGMSDTSSPQATYLIVPINYSMSNRIILQLVLSVTLNIYYKEEKHYVDDIKVNKCFIFIFGGW